MPPRERPLIAAAIIEAIGEAFPGDTLLTEVARAWIGYETAPPPNCAVCGRSLVGAFAVEWGSMSPRLLDGKNAGTHAVCPACLEAARDIWASSTYAVESWRMPEGRPQWDMAMAQLERVLALLPEEDAVVAREWLARHPDTPAEGTCTLCEKKTQVIAGHAGGLCETCGRDGRFVLHDLAARKEVEGSRCPDCGSRDVAAAAVGIEFTEMTCVACGHSEICDVWQLDDWNG